MTDLRLTVDGRQLTAQWTDENPETREAIEEALPLAGDATRWGDELYFGVPVDAPLEDAREVVAAGSVAYWPEGSVLCLFWGPTPMSEGDEPRASSSVNVVARVDDVSALGDVEGDASMRVEASPGP